MFAGTQKVPKYAPCNSSVCVKRFSWKACLLSGCLLLLLGNTASGLAQAEQGRLELVHADSGRSVIEGGFSVMELIGNVKFVQDSLEINCDRARRIPQRNLVELLGNVDVREGKKRLRAERVNYFEDRHVQEAIGNVKMSDEASELTAHKVTYLERDSLVIAELDVVLNQQEKRVRLTCGKAEYRRRDEYAKATVKPVLVELDSLGAENMRITGDVVEMFNGGSRAKVTNNVEIIRQETRATCGEAEYFRDEKRLELRLDPVAWREDEETKGTTIGLFFNEDQKLTRSVVSGKATATSTIDSVRAGQRINALSGGTITTHFKNERAHKVVVEETATSLYYVIEEGREKGTNRVQGDRITLFVEDQELKRVVVESSPGVSNGRFDPANSVVPAGAAKAQTMKTGN